jgi:hypothetical protein
VKLAVVGSRSITDKRRIFSTLKDYYSAHDDLTIVSGGAKGVDSIAAEFAKENGLSLIEIRPKWRVNGVFDKSAGFKRNVDIWKEADAGVAFWDGKSKGTAHSFDLAKQYGKHLEVVYCNVD